MNGNGKGLDPQKCKDITIFHAIIGDKSVAFVFGERGYEKSAQQAPNDHGVAHKGTAKNLNSQKYQKYGKAHGNVGSRSITKTDIAITGANGIIGIAGASYATTPKANTGPGQLNANHGDRHPQDVGGKGALENLGGHKGDKGFEPNAKHDGTNECAPRFVNGIASRHDVIPETTEWTKC